MAIHTFVDIQIPEAAQYAALSGVRIDFLSTSNLCEFLKEEFKSGRPRSEIVDAFSAAIVIRYCRAFSSGVRKWPWEEALASLTDDQRKYHEIFLHLRNKHIAHSLNAFEENRVQARYVLERADEEGITGISASSSMLTGLSSHNLTMIQGLCKSLMSFVEKQLSEEQKKLLPIIRAIPLMILKEQEPPLAGPPDFKRIHVRRESP